MQPENYINRAHVWWKLLQLLKIMECLENIAFGLGIWTYAMVKNSLINLSHKIWPHGIYLYNF
jgi:hypothetical protein